MNNSLPTRRQHTRATKRRRGWKTYTDEEVCTLVSESLKNIAEILERREKGLEIRDRYSTWDFGTRPNSKEEYIAYWLCKLDGIPLRFSELEGNGHRWFVRGLQRCG